jgi:hypothetical protein
VGGPSFSWDAAFGSKLWVAELRVSNAPSGPLADPRLRLAVHGAFTADHHFGIEIWDQPPNITTARPIDVFLTMQSVASLMSARVTTREVRYRR